jgi:molybdopterin/thiamine biosynthesis adenylyltransferase
MTQVTHATLSDRDLRQRDLIPPEALAKSSCTVIGVGAIGRQVALQLAAIGVPQLQLIDFDTVEEVNLAPQGFLHDDLGRPKVQATADLCQQIYPMLDVVEINDRFRRSQHEVGNVVFCCVDSIDTRRLIWQSVQEHVQFFSDGRMSGEVIRILTVAGEQDRQHYPTTLFTSGEAFRGTCTARSTIYTANIAAGLMIQQFSRWLRHLPVDTDLQLNLLSSELSVIC